MTFNKQPPNETLTGISSFFHNHKMNTCSMLKKKHGVVELFAQTAELSWDVPSGASVAVPETYDEPCVFPPLILQNQKASTTFAALERGLEGEVCLDWATVVRMTYIANIVLLILGSDLASSNVRLKLGDLSTSCRTL